MATLHLFLSSLFLFLSLFISQAIPSAAVSVSIPVAIRPTGDCKYASSITGSVPLIAGQNINAGTVSYVITDSGSGAFSVEVDVSADTTKCSVEPDAHVDLVSSLKTKGPELAPGRWPCSANPTTDVFKMSCAFGDLKCCDVKYLYVHVVLKCSGSSETAFAGLGECTGKRWCRYIEVSPPCGDCDCDTAGDKCFVKKSCGDFPETCTFDPICENKIPGECSIPTQCTEEQKKCDVQQICPAPSKIGVPTECITPVPCDGDLGVDHCNTGNVCKQSDCIPLTNCPEKERCGPLKICDNLDGLMGVPSSVPTKCVPEVPCEGTIGEDHCNVDTVCKQDACTDITTCPCGEKACPNLKDNPLAPPGLPTSCKEKISCPGTLGVDHCNNEKVCSEDQCTAPQACPGNKCGGPICPKLAGVPDLPSTVMTACTDKLTCTGTLGQDHCNPDGVCHLSECTSPTSCPGDKCGGPICADLAGLPGLPDTVKTSCTDKLTCTGTLGVQHCNLDGVCHLDECVPPTNCPDDKCGGPICAGLSGEPHLPSTVKTMCTEKQVCGAGTTDIYCTTDPVCELSSCVKATECDADKRCNGQFVCPAPNQLEGLGTECVGKSDCGFAGCSIDACPGECPGGCPDTCPPCFKPNPLGAGVEPKCVPDETTNDKDCDPCANGGDALCKDAVEQSFKCCPPSSNCKANVIPSRIGTPQDQLKVSFVCSANCGEGCDTIDNKGDSNACTLFSPLNLGVDGMTDTDDILNVCDDLTADRR